jgi:hypothetical protein
MARVRFRLCFASAEATIRRSAPRQSATGALPEWRNGGDRAGRRGQLLVVQPATGRPNERDSREPSVRSFGSALVFIKQGEPDPVSDPDLNQGEILSTVT